MTTASDFQSYIKPLFFFRCVIEFTNQEKSKKLSSMQYCDSFINETVSHCFACSWKMLSNSFQLSSCIHSQLDKLTYCKLSIYKMFIASENSLCYLFSLTARRKLDELFAQFDNVTTACQFHIYTWLSHFHKCTELRGICDCEYLPTSLYVE